MTDVPTIAVRSGDVLREGPVPDLADASLRRVNLEGNLWHRQDLASQEAGTVQLDTALAGFAPTLARGRIGACGEGPAFAIQQRCAQMAQRFPALMPRPAFSGLVSHD